MNREHNIDIYTNKCLGLYVVVLYFCLSVTTMYAGIWFRNIFFTSNVNNCAGICVTMNDISTTQVRISNSMHYGLFRIECIIFTLELDIEYR